MFFIHPTIVFFLCFVEFSLKLVYSHLLKCLLMGSCLSGCISLLGMEGGAIVESQITASSVHYGVLGLQRWGPELARLNNQGIVNAWTSASHDRNPWIEVRLEAFSAARRCVLQAWRRRLPCFSHLLARVCALQVFVGNSDNDGTKTNMFDPPVVAQFLRIVPVVCRRACTLRMELVGCELNGCSEPLGMKSRLVSDEQLSASSTFRTWGVDTFTWHPQFARLDKAGKTNAWSPDSAESHGPLFCLQVDLGKTKRLTGIITQGAKDFGVVQFVSEFKVEFSHDGAAWTLPSLSSSQIFQGNVDNNSHRKNVFEPPFYARYVRVVPWAWHDRITLRMELLGCDD
uniref:Milk fat globule EGF and factor V/VIII domain containing a n=1 Tax=Kryptolebias marmoratus TaxID=37003 RepID=A0A3Q3APV4_KRYMA